MHLKTNDPTRLLWTGGWDSTYRLLDLAIVQKRRVQPIYVVDRRRPSWPVEVATMEKIRARLNAHDPNAGDRLAQTLVFELGDVAEDSSITDAFRRLRAVSMIGSQYDWLPRAMKQHNIKPVEIAVERCGHIRGIDFHLNGQVRQDGDAMVVQNLTGDLKIFSGFRFPVLHMSKRDMAKCAKENGFFELMKLTWFCHQPDAKGRPCGICNPCHFTIWEGLGWRLPLRRRVRHRHYALTNALKSKLKEYPQLYQRARGIKRSLSRRAL